MSLIIAIYRLEWLRKPGKDRALSFSGPDYAFKLREGQNVYVVDFVVVHLWLALSTIVNSLFDSTAAGTLGDFEWISGSYTDNFANIAKNMLTACFLMRPWITLYLD